MTQHGHSVKAASASSQPPTFSEACGSRKRLYVVFGVAFFFISVHKEGAVACGDAGDQDTSSSV